MTEKELIAAAEDLARHRIIVGKLIMMRRPAKIEKRVKMDAAVMLARAKLRHLEFVYEDALHQFSRGE